MSILLTAGTLVAQDTRGSIGGSALDSSGAAIAGVKISATNIASGTTASSISNATGEYLLPYLIPGTYRMNAESVGFKSFVRSAVEIRTGDRLRIDVVMEVGQQSERVTVAADTPMLETTTASVGHVIERRWLSDLPILHDNLLLLTALVPGVTNTSTSATFQSTSPSAPGAYQYALGGSPSSSQEITLDGASNTSTLAGNGNRGIAFTPPADLVGEFRVQTAGFDASVGNTTGGSISLSLKSGTNTFHGTAAYSTVKPRWNANDFFANKAGQPRAALFTNHEVVTVGGPIYIPKLYNGKNRTFFIYGWDREPRNAPFAFGTYTVPTERHRQGDFSDLLRVGANYQIYDPHSATLVNGRVTRSPLPGNILAASRINPIAKKIVDYYPMPLVPGLANTTLNYPEPNLLSIVSYNTHTGRIDHNISERFRVFLRGNWMERPALQNDDFNNIATGLYGAQRGRGGQLDTVYTFSPSLVMNLRYSYTRWITDSVSKSRGMDISTLGFPTSLSQPLGPNSGFPRIVISGITTSSGAIGYGGGGTYNATNTHDLAGKFNWVRGKHITSFGTEVRNYMQNQHDFQNSPSFTFGTTYTQGPANNATPSPSGVGQGLASFLLGIPTAGSIAVPTAVAASSPHVSLFFQDDWRLTPRLTLNLGLRWEAEGALSERFNRSVRSFDTETLNSLNAQVAATYARSPLAELPVAQFSVRGGLKFEGVNGEPHALYSTPKKNFAPRVGFAYSATNDTVIRAAYGIFFGFLGQQANSSNTLIQSGFNQSTSFVPTLNDGLTFTATLSNPFPDGVQQPTGSTAGLNTFLGRGISFYNSNPTTPYFQIWSFSIQRALPWRMVAEVGYMGNRGAHLRTARGLQYFDQKYLSRLPNRDQATIDYWSAQLPNPFYPLLPGTGLAAAVLSRSTLSQMANFPQFTGVATTDNAGSSWYHAFTSKLQKRLTSGITMDVTYTRSKLLNAVTRLNGQSSPLERVISANDRPYSLSFNSIYELPFGRGKLLGVNNRVLAQLIENWRIGLTWVAQGGAPLGFGNALLTAPLESIALDNSQRTVDRWFNIDAFNRRTTEQLSFNYVTLSSLLSGVRGPGMNVWSGRLMKSIRFGERVDLQLRADAMNMLNHTNFAAPNTSPTAAAFGLISNTSASARMIQLGVKAVW